MEQKRLERLAAKAECLAAEEEAERAAQPAEEEEEERAAEAELEAMRAEAQKTREEEEARLSVLNGDGGDGAGEGDESGLLKGSADFLFRCEPRTSINILQVHGASAWCECMV